MLSAFNNCNTTKVVKSWVKLPEKPFKNDAKMDILTYVKMSRLVGLFLYTSAGDNAFRSNPLRLKRLQGFSLTS